MPSKWLLNGFDITFNKQFTKKYIKMPRIECIEFSKEWHLFNFWCSKSKKSFSCTLKAIFNLWLIIFYRVAKSVNLNVGNTILNTYIYFNTLRLWLALKAVIY